MHDSFTNVISDDKGKAHSEQSLRSGVKSKAYADFAVRILTHSPLFSFLHAQSHTDLSTCDTACACDLKIIEYLDNYTPYSLVVFHSHYRRVDSL